MPTLFYFSFSDCEQAMLHSDFLPGVHNMTFEYLGMNRSYTGVCNGDGFTVFQSRGQFGNPVNYFTIKPWADYVAGFGTPGDYSSSCLPTAMSRAENILIPIHNNP